MQELAALAEVTRAMSASLDLDQSLRTISTHATQLTRSDSASIFLYDEAREAFEIRASYNTPERFILEVEGQRILGARGPIDEARRNARREHPGRVHPWEGEHIHVHDTYCRIVNRG